jgi:hypothetical protein
MSNTRDRKPPLGQGTGVASLVTAVVCVLASDALASRPSVEPYVGEQALSARVAAIVERVRLADPALVRDLPPTMKMAQWRN